MYWDSNESAKSKIIRGNKYDLFRDLIGYYNLYKSKLVLETMYLISATYLLFNIIKNIRTYQANFMYTTQIKRKYSVP